MYLDCWGLIYSKENDKIFIENVYVNEKFFFSNID